MSNLQDLPHRFIHKPYKYYNKDLLHLTDEQLKDHYLVHRKIDLILSIVNMTDCFK